MRVYRKTHELEEQTFLRRSNASGARAWGVLSGWMTRYQTTYEGAINISIRGHQGAGHGCAPEVGRLTKRELSVFLLDVFGRSVFVNVKNLVRTVQGERSGGKRSTTVRA